MKKWWDEDGRKSSHPGIPEDGLGYIGESYGEALALRLRIDEITRVLAQSGAEIEDALVLPGPSPPPEYDGQGRRTNTREARVRQELLQERHELVEEARRLSPGFVPPADYRQIRQRKMHRVYFPIDKFPDYNFMGLIIGPRGDTHKKLEQDSGARIFIRGKGALRDGGRPRFESEESEPMHVLIIADTDEQMAKAKEMIERLIVPIDDESNDHKQAQLRMLAAYNGTLRERSRVVLRSRRDQEGANVPRVQCAICKETSHPTSDCPQRMGSQLPRRVDVELDQFLASLEPEDGHTPTAASDSSAPNPSSIQSAVDDFLSTLQ